jgi:methionine-rich copper-binding protein CopC
MRTVRSLLLSAPWLVVPGVLSGALAQDSAPPGAHACEGLAPPALQDCDHAGCGKAAALRRRAALGLPISDESAPIAVPEELMPDTDVLNVALDIEINPAVGATITGTCTYTLRVRSATLTEFTFRLRSQFVVGTVLVNGVAVAPANIVSLSTTSRKITLPRTFAQNETLTVTIPYSGTAVSRGLGSIEFTTQNGSPLASSLSEPFYAYTWWPAKDGDFGLAGDNSDKFPIQFSITAPSNLTSVSNGLLQGVDALSGGRSRYRWATAIPLSTYLVCFSTTNYNAWTRTWAYPGGSMPVQFYIYPANDTAANRAAWEVVLPALTLYSGLYGTYPFVAEKYGIYQFPFSGGMEHQTMTGQGTFSEAVSVHELAHQWWGDHVTCKTWSDIWLNEGFADYSEALWFERKAGSTGLPALKSAMAARRPAAGSDTVYVANPSTDARIFQTSTTYYKAGWVLHMLRHCVGDQAFFDILAAYRAAFAGSAATTDDFRAVASGVVGKDLSTFFSQWVFGTGEVAYASGFDNITVNGQRYARVHIRQTQSAAYGTNGRFEMPVDVALAGAAGSATTVVQNTRTLQHYVIPVTQPITGVTLDPDDWILASAKASEALVLGPPKVVQTLPAPGSALPAAPAPIDVFFSAPINAAPGQFTLTGPAGQVACDVVYSAPNQRVRVTPLSPLAPGAYTLGISATLTATTGGLALDGEFPGTLPGLSLPSGDGLAGGNAAIPFTVAPASCPSDYNRDGFLNLDDLGDFITDYYILPPIPGGSQPLAPTFPGQAVGFGTPCPAAPDAPAPYAANAYRQFGYRVGFSPDAGNACPIAPDAAFPNLDNLGDYLTAYYASLGQPGC